MSRTRPVKKFLLMIGLVIGMYSHNIFAGGSTFDIRNTIAYFGGSAQGEPTFYLGKNSQGADCIVDITVYTGGAIGYSGIAGVRVFVGNKDSEKAYFDMLVQSKSSNFQRLPGKMGDSLSASNGEMTLLVDRMKTRDRVSVEKQGEILTSCTLTGSERISGYIPE